jgi:hypothetical protein
VRQKILEVSLVVQFSKKLLTLDAPKDLKISLYSGSKVDKPIDTETAIGKKEIINAIKTVFKSC